jgi:hypothetical protein
MEPKKKFIARNVINSSHITLSFSSIIALVLWDKKKLILISQYDAKISTSLGINVVLLLDYNFLDTFILFAIHSDPIGSRSNAININRRPLSAIPRSY